MTFMPTFERSPGRRCGVAVPEDELRAEPVAAAYEAGGDREVVAARAKRRATDQHQDESELRV